MIPDGSRYEKGTLVQVTLPDGSFRWSLYASRYSQVRVMAYRYRTAVEGDRFELMAAREYGDSLLWWVIARANPEIFYPDEIPPGVVVRIPSAASIR
jgi:hypothetical protein